MDPGNKCRDDTNFVVSIVGALNRPADRIGYALRGLDYFAVQPIEPIWASAGVRFADDKGNVDFDKPEAVAITEKWIGMYSKDKSAQSTAVNDR